MSDATVVTSAIQEAFNKLADLAMAYGPKAGELGAEVERADAQGNLLRAWGAAGIAIVFGFVASIAAWRLIEAEKANKYSSGEGWFGVLVPCGFISVIFLLGSLLGILDWWNWVALDNPKLALAHDLMVKAGL